MHSLRTTQLHLCLLCQQIHPTNPTPCKIFILHPAGGVLFRLKVRGLRNLKCSLSCLWRHNQCLKLFSAETLRPIKRVYYCVRPIPQKQMATQSVRIYENGLARQRRNFRIRAFGCDLLFSCILIFRNGLEIRRKTRKCGFLSNCILEHKQ